MDKEFKIKVTSRVHTINMSYPILIGNVYTMYDKFTNGRGVVQYLYAEPYEDGNRYIDSRDCRILSTKLRGGKR